MSLFPPFFGALLKGRKSEGPNTEHRPIAITPGGAAKVMLETATSPVFPGASPPATVDGTALWLNTNPGQEGLFFYDLTRGKWLSTSLEWFDVGDDAADNQVMRITGVNTPGDGAGQLLPAVDVTLVGIAARSRDGNLTKSFDLRRRAASDVVVTSFTLAATAFGGASFDSMTLDVDIPNVVDQFFDVFAEGAGASSQDVFIRCFYRRKETP